MSPTRRVDPILGIEKLCNVCGEWWPLDEEFWYVKVHRAGEVQRTHGGRTYVRRTDGLHWYSRCRACWSERNRDQHLRRRAS